MHARSFHFSVIRRTLAWTAASVTWVRDHSCAYVYTRGLGTPTGRGGGIAHCYQSKPVEHSNQQRCFGCRCQFWNNVSFFQTKYIDVSCKKLQQLQPRKTRQVGKLGFERSVNRFGYTRIRASHNWSNHTLQSFHSSRHCTVFVWRRFGVNEVEWTAKRNKNKNKKKLQQQKNKKINKNNNNNTQQKWQRHTTAAATTTTPAWVSTGLLLQINSATVPFLFLQLLIPSVLIIKEKNPQ